MEQKEAASRTGNRANSTTDLEKEITGSPEETGPDSNPVATAQLPEVPEGDVASEAEPDQEQEQALLPLASGVGRRLKRRRSPAPLKVKEPDEAAGELADPADPEDYPLAAWRARTPDNRGLGRGGLAAVVLLVIFVPTFFFFLYLLYSNTERIDAIRQNLAAFNDSGAVAVASGTASPENSLVQLLNRAGTQMYPLKVENLSPSGRVVFYTDNNTLAFTYGNLDPLDADQVYTVWLSTKPAGSADAAYVRLANLPNNHTNGSTMLVNQGALPANFKLTNYAEIIVTVEKVDQKNDKPSGPRAFSLDLTQRKS